MPRSITETALRQAPTLNQHVTVREALAALIESDLPALPLVDENGRYKGLFGEREFIGALFPGYLDQLSSSSFIAHSLDDAIERRSECLTHAVKDYANTEHIDVGPDAGDVQLAEIFLHHRVLVAPVTDDGRVVGVVTRAAFFHGLAERVLDLSSPE